MTITKDKRTYIYENNSIIVLENLKPILFAFDVKSDLTEEALITYSDALVEENQCNK